MTEPLGPKIRKQRRRLGLTLDELAVKTSISKPYLSLIETGRVPNPPSDEKLRRLETTLGFAANELVTQAHLQRTPGDVRLMLQKLLADRAKGTAGTLASSSPSAKTQLKPGFAGAVNLDDAYTSGALAELVERSVGNVERVATNSVPVINKISAGYPRDFSDLSYPPRVADEYVGCPDVFDRDAFAARVHGDSMTPKYREGDIVIFSPALNPKNGDDCFVRFGDGQTTFKRVFFEQDEEGQAVIRLQPRNERYRPQVIRSEEVAGLYKAVFRYQRVDEE
jgi:SOS-response transcriptional repressor LexA